MQINRLFETVYILMNKKTVTAGELAEHFEVSVRTIYRDVEALSQAGIPIYMSKGRGGGISLLPEFTLNKTVLNEKERADLLLALKAAQFAGLGGTEATLKKLSALFGPHHADWLEVDLSPWSGAPDGRDVFESLKRAVIEHYIVRFNYSSAKGEAAEREVEPLKLCFKGGGWYLYAFCRLRQEDRFFKLTRLRNIYVSEETFSRAAASNVLPDKLPEGDHVNLKLRLSDKAAFRALDEFENPRKLEDGRFIVEIKMPRGEWIYNYIFSFGDNCELLEPADIREAVKTKLEKSLAQYL